MIEAEPADAPALPDSVPGEGIPGAVAWATTAMGLLLGAATFWVVLSSDAPAVARHRPQARTAAMAVPPPAAPAPTPRALAPPVAPDEAPVAAPAPPPEVPALAPAVRDEVMQLDPVLVPPGTGDDACVALRLVYAPNAHKPGRDDRARLQRLADQLRGAPVDEILVQAYTDTQGDAAENLARSHRRAVWVREALAGAGVDRRHLTAQAFGEYVPQPGIAPGDPRNRRVEVRVRGGQCPDLEAPAP